MSSPSLPVTSLGRTLRSKGRASHTPSIDTAGLDDKTQNELKRLQMAKFAVKMNNDYAHELESGSLVE